MTTETRLERNRARCLVCRDPVDPPTSVAGDVLLRRCNKPLAAFLAEHNVISSRTTSSTSLDASTLTVTVCLPCNTLATRCDEWLFCFNDGIRSLRARAAGQEGRDGGPVDVSVDLDPLVVVKTENVSTYRALKHLNRFSPKRSS
jgi:hypothetical protein